jgi:hypothetical protein
MLKIADAAAVGVSVLCAVGSATGPPASAFERYLELTNNTRMAIVEIYAAPVGSGRWQPDLLKDAILPPANSMQVNMDIGGAYCRFDFKIVFDDGTNWIRRDLDVCALQGYAITYR